MGTGQISSSCVRWVIYYLADYYRNQTIKTLLSARLTLHVFGDGWKRWPRRDEPNLVRHQAVMGKDALEVYARAKVSLNIMTWHKDGFTERIANAMRQKSAVVTDRTAYLEKILWTGKSFCCLIWDTWTNCREGAACKRAKAKRDCAKRL